MISARPAPERRDSFDFAVRTSPVSGGDLRRSGLERGEHCPARRAGAPRDSSTRRGLELARPALRGRVGSPGPEGVSAGGGIREAIDSTARPLVLERRLAAAPALPARRAFPPPRRRGRCASRFRDIRARSCPRPRRRGIARRPAARCRATSSDHSLRLRRERNLHTDGPRGRWTSRRRRPACASADSAGFGWNASAEDPAGRAQGTDAHRRPAPSLTGGSFVRRRA